VRVPVNLCQGWENVGFKDFFRFLGNLGCNVIVTGPDATYYRQID